MSKFTKEPKKELSVLGKSTVYPKSYAPELLEAVPRELNRKQLRNSHTGNKSEVELAFHGYDLWHAYELSWLNNKNKPSVGLLKLYIPAQSESIVESKSFKLYLNSFNQTQFVNTEAVIETIKTDLDKLLRTAVIIKFYAPDAIEAFFHGSGGEVGQLGDFLVAEADFHVGTQLEVVAGKCRKLLLDAF